jgi:hypothetical protein
MCIACAIVTIDRTALDFQVLRRSSEYETGRSPELREQLGRLVESGSEIRSCDCDVEVSRIRSFRAPSLQILEYSTPYGMIEVGTSEDGVPQKLLILVIEPEALIHRPPEENRGTR